MLALGATTVYHEPMAVQTEFAALRFQDGDTNLELFESPENTPLRFQAVFGEKAIAFYRLDEEGLRPELPSDPARIEHRPDSPLLGETSYSIYVKPDGDDRFWWYGYSTSTVATLNAVAQSSVQPLGAHTMPVELRDADTEDGLFKADTMTQAIADGVFIISTSPRHYLHDTREHGRGIICLEAETAATLRTICQLAHLEEKRSPMIKQFIESIISAYDLTTFQYSRPGSGARLRQLELTRRDPMMTEIMWQAARKRQLPNDSMAKLVKSIERGPFTYNFKRKEVRRYPRVIKYYESINDLID